MKKRILAVLLVLLPFALPLKVGALGLGEIELFSALNEPLNARIPLRAVKGGDLDALRVTLASSTQFQRAGIERPYVLSSLRFDVSGSGSRGVIKITTAEPVTEPFLNFLLDVDWNRGRVIREYTVLLDPPIYGAAISATVDEAVTTVDKFPELAAPEPEVIPTQTSTTSSATSGSTTSSTTASINPGSYRVRTGDTLWGLADQFRPAGTTVQQSMLAILRANPEAFSQNNVNALQAGAVLNIPGADAVETIGASAALAEVKQQHALWEQYRQAASTNVSEAATGAVAESGAGDSTTEVSEPDETVSSTASDTSDDDASQLSLVSGGTAEAGAGGNSTDVGALQEELLAAAEETDAQRQQNQELRSKLTEADEIITDLQRLVDVKDDDIANLQAQLVETEAALEAAREEAAQIDTSVVATEIETSPDTTTQVDTETSSETRIEPEPEPEITPAVKSDQQRTRPGPQTFVDKLLSMLPIDPVLLAGGVGGLLALVLGGLFFAKRRKSKAEWVDLEVDETLETSAAHEDPGAHGELSEDLPIEEVEEFNLDEAVEDDVDEASQTVAAMAPSDPEDDPLEGLNIYLAYEDYDNATKLVKGVIAQHPERHEYKLRLLEIYFAAKNPAAFEDSATELQSAVGDDSPMMEKAHRWWDELATGRALFGPAEDTGVLDTDLEPDDEAIFDVTGANDSALGQDDTMEISLDDVEAEGDGGGVDFDLGFEFETSAEEVDSPTADSESLDFALDGDDSASELTSDSDPLDLDFTLDGDESSAEQAAVGATDELDIDFDLDSSEASDSEDLLDLDTTVDMSQVPQDDDSSGSIAAGVAAVGGLAAIGAVALASSDDDDAEASDDGSIDFDLDFDSEPTDPIADAEEPVAAQSTDDLDFSLDEDSPEADDGGDALDFSLDETTPLDESTSDLDSEDDALDFKLDSTSDSEQDNLIVGDDSAIDVDNELDDDVLDFALDIGEEPAAEQADVGIDPVASVAPETTEDDGFALDFDLGDSDSSEDETSTGEFAIGANEAMSGSSEEDIDSDETVDLNSEMGDLDLDFDMSLDDDESLEPESPDDALDLDFDLGLGEESEAAPEAGEDASSTQYMLRDVPPITEPPSELADSGLDLDLGFDMDADTATDDESGAGTVFTLDQPDVNALSNDDLDLTLDIGEVDADATEELDLDLTLDLEVPGDDSGDESGLLDINSALESEGSNTDNEIPELDFDLDDTGTLSPANDFETVQINPDDLAGAGVLTDEEAASLSETGDGIEVDDDFADLFGSNDENESLDEDFGLELPDSAAAAAAESSDGTEITGLDFESEESDEDSESGDYEKTQFMLRDIAALTSEGDEDDENSTLALGRGGDGELDEMQTKLDLAQAYIDMGDVEGARGILGEVMAEGNDGQQEIAKRLLERLN